MKNYKRNLLLEGMSLDQIKQGLNSDLLIMLNRFRKTVFLNADHDLNIKKFFDDTLQDIENEELQGLCTKEEGDNKFELCKNAYIDFVLVNVIENGQSLQPMIDIINPTGGVKGKYTEFILRILSSTLFENRIRNWSMISNFLKICKNTSSKVYQSKNAFFDNIIIPLMDKRVANGEKLGSVNPETGIRGSNFSRPSPTAALPDKIMKVFEAYGKYNDRNLLQTVIDEVVPEASGGSIKTFAGYDVKLIDYCLAKKYWKEFFVPSQPSSTRFFFIGNGDLENLPGNEFRLDEDAAYESWVQLDPYEQYEIGDFETYIGILENEGLPEYNKNTTQKRSFSSYFVLRALTYACNIAPFKTEYNISKSNSGISSSEVAFYKSLSNDDYLVPEHNYDLKIRKTTSWCTKDEDQLSKYITPGANDQVEGFILCLNNSLPFDDPNGALQLGINQRRDTDGVNRYKITTSLNADDGDCKCPDILTSFFEKYQEGVKKLIDYDRQNLSKIKKLSFPEQNNTMSSEDEKAYFEQMQKESITESLLRNYIRQLLK